MHPTSALCADNVRVQCMLCGDLLGADNRVAKSDGSDVRGTWLQLMCCTFLNIYVLNLPQRVGSGECQRWSELGWRCRTRVGWRETKSGS